VKVEEEDWSCLNVGGWALCADSSRYRGWYTISSLEGTADGRLNSVQSTYERLNLIFST
jgi:hypothetical protein